MGNGVARWVGGSLGRSNSSQTESESGDIQMTNGADFTETWARWDSAIPTGVRRSLAKAGVTDPLWASDSNGGRPWLVVGGTAVAHRPERLIRVFQSGGRWKVRTLASGKPRMQGLSFDSVPLARDGKPDTLFVPATRWLPDFVPFEAEELIRFDGIKDHDASICRTFRGAETTEHVSMWACSARTTVFVNLQRKARSAPPTPGVDLDRLIDLALSRTRWTGTYVRWDANLDTTAVKAGNVRKSLCS